MSQLLDNHKNQSVYKFLKDKITTPGRLNVVTGFVSPSALAAFGSDLDTYVEAYRIVVGEFADQELGKSKSLDLFDQELELEKVLSQSQTARKAVAFLEQTKVEAKTLQPNFCHAKMYLYDKTSDIENHFHVIGSANLTGAGIGLHERSNLELSVASEAGENQFVEARKWFEELWNRPESRAKINVPEQGNISFKEYLIFKIKQLFDAYKPYDLYYKILFELYKEVLEELDFDLTTKKQIRHLEETAIWKALYSFQQKGVLSLIRILQKYNGAILADAVGLGKTWSALAVMKFHEDLGYKVILICPKKLENNWIRYRKGQYSRFEVDELDYMVCYHTDMQDGRYRADTKDFGRIGKFLDSQSSQKVLVVIDESHNFKNDKSNRYHCLVEEILKKKEEVKVLLLSATPINNKLLDVRNQFKLLTCGDNHGFGKKDEATGEPLFPNLKKDHSNLESSFKQAEEAFKNWTNLGDNKTITDLIQLLGDRFFTLTDALIMARTREMIQQLDPNIKFPKKEAVNHYLGAPKMGSFTDLQSIIDALDFRMSAYRPAEYCAVQLNIDILHDDVARQGFLVQMMFILLTKRLESCWYAFEITLNRILDHHINALAKVEAYKAGNVKVDLTEASETDVSELEEQEEDDSETGTTEPESKAEKIDTSKLTLGKKRPVPLSQMTKLPLFEKHLREDIEKLTALKTQAAILHKQMDEETSATESGDPKLQELMAFLKSKESAPNKKTIIFTTYTDTAKYLYKELKKRGFGKMGLVTGDGAVSENFSGPKFEPLLERFAPYTKLYKEKDWYDLFARYGKADDFEEWKKLIETHGSDKDKEILADEIDILIASDCLSEGQNLQDADTVINYDIHWNPVRLIQRLGRIDRIGSPNEKVKGINFWPADTFDHYLNLRTRVNNRMALVVLTGGEHAPTNEELQRMIAENPLITDQQRRFYEQMNEGWDGIETGEQTFGMDNLSLETFRQELLDELKRRKGFYEAMPLGCFSGVQLRPQTDPKPNPLADPNPHGIIGLLGYPKKPAEAVNHTYAEHELVYVSPDGKRAKWTRFEILSLLRVHKMEDRKVTNALDTGDVATVKAYMSWFEQWFPQRLEQLVGDVAEDAFDLNYVPNPQNQQLENQLKPDNYDLLAWIEMNRPNELPDES